MVTETNHSVHSAGIGGGAGLRRSDRVTMELPIEIGGTDARGVVFFEPAKTAVVSRHGAKIVSRRALSPNQAIRITCRLTGNEAAARVVAELEKSIEGYWYGVAFLDEEANPWDIEFPDLAESERAEARVLLECAGCGARRVTYLNAFEAEVLEVHHRLSFYCTRCVETTVWWPASARPSEVPAMQTMSRPKADLPPGRSADERREARTQIHMSVFIRHPQLGEEIGKTTDISRAGFGFTGRKFYMPGTFMEVALPYAPGLANIFCPAQVQHCEHLENEGTFLCGVSYIQIHRGWPGK